MISTPFSLSLCLITSSLVPLTDLVASSITKVLKPHLWASRAVEPTQKSKASPTTQTSLMLQFSSRVLSQLVWLCQLKPLQESRLGKMPLLMMMSEGSVWRRGDSWAPLVPATQWSGQSYCCLPSMAMVVKACSWWVEAKETCLGGCQSLVRMTCENRSFLFLSAFMGAKISLLPGTASEPFSQKSF